MFCIGDIDKVTKSPTALPIIEVYWEATKSRHGTNVLVTMMAFILFISLFNIFASVSRLTWSFAKDHGLPFSSAFSYLHPQLNVPVNALLLVGVICALLALINIGSTTAFNALISLPLISLYISYCIPITFILIRKLRGQQNRYGPFKLGRWGIPINTFAIVYILFILSFVALPTIRPVTGSNMNYAGPLAAAVMLVALGDWFIHGRRRFQVPVSRAVEDL